MTTDISPAKDKQARTDRRLSICFISRALPAHRLGGLEYHLRDLAVAMARRGYTIHILTTSGESRDQLSADVAGVTIHVIPGTKPGDYSVSFFLRVKKSATEICACHNIDVLCPIDMAGLFLSPADFNAVTVPIIHGTMTSEVPLDWRYWPRLGILDKINAAWRYKSRIALRGPFQRMIQRAEAVIVDSEFSRRELMFAGINNKTKPRNWRAGNTAWSEGEKAAALAEKIYVVPLGIDMERYPKPVAGNDKNRSGDEKFRICMLGRLQKVKGVEQAIYAAQTLKARGVKFRLTIGGSGNFAGEAKMLAAYLGVEKHVVFPGRVEPQDLAELFEDHDVFLLPDLTQPAFGLVAVEAMQYGLPVVAANVGAVSEVVGDCGWFYDAWDVNQLASLIASLAVNPDEVARKASGARLQHLNFTAEKMAKRTEKVLREILSEKRC